MAIDQGQNEIFDIGWTHDAQRIHEKGNSAANNEFAVYKL